MKKASTSLIEGDRLRAVFDDENFKQTIGLWLKEIREEAVSEMAREDDPVRNARARGKYSAVQSIFDRIELANSRYDAAAKQVQREAEKAIKEKEGNQ